MSRSITMPDGLRRAYVLALAPSALVAPLPLLWTEGASRSAVVGYVLAVTYLWRRASTGRPAHLSDAAQNVLGLVYLGWLALETATLRMGLLRSVSHLLLFTALAKLASMKRPGEARLALLIVFLLALASASSSTHVSSLFYFAAMSWLGFRTLARVAVLADFDEAPPERVLTSVPTGGLSVIALAGGAVAAVPLFFALPRLHGPFVLAPFHVEDAFSKALSSDRVDLESFGAAKRSDRIVLRMASRPDITRDSPLRLREAVFTEYQDGSWIRSPWRGPRRGQALVYGVGDRPSIPDPTWRISADLYVYGQGFLFLPYGTEAVRVEKGRASEIPDGVMQVASGRGPVRYEADVRRQLARGPGTSAISPADVPEEIQKYAIRLTGDLTDGFAIYRRIEENFQRNFVYTLDPPRAQGDPLVHFLLRSRAGHCEYFASAAAMILAARGVRARLVTGSFGGEEGLFSSSIVVRAENLHAWVEADFDGRGFQVVDPTPAAGVPPALTSFSLLSRLVAFGREVEFFYDRRILGYDAGDQVGAIEAMRASLGDVAAGLSAFRQSARALFSAKTAAGLLGVVGLAALLHSLTRRARGATPPATRAYLALRRLVARRRGALADSVPPAEVARLLGQEVPALSGDAQAVVAAYCASAFGGSRLRPEAERDLSDRLRRLKKLA